MAEINNRIEEVKKAIARAKAIAITVKRPFEDVLVDEIRQLFPQPLDDKELREKVKKIIQRQLQESEAQWGISMEYVDQILALLQPKIEEAKWQGEFKGLALGFTEGAEKGIAMGRREERKKLLDEIELVVLNELNQNLNNYPWWQALKGGE